MKALDRVGQRYGRLVVTKAVREYKKFDKRRGVHWLDWVFYCKCDCGNECKQISSNILKVESCGCFRKEVHTKHGMSQHPVYAVWVQIIQRCENPKAVGYDKYGAKGITVCKRWHRFENFIKDMGPRPEKGQWTVERKDGKKGYGPSNCRWATPWEQSRNIPSNNVWVEIDGVKKVLEDWIAGRDISVMTVSKRLKAGWDPKKAIETPPRMCGRRSWMKARGLDQRHNRLREARVKGREGS